MFNDKKTLGQMKKGGSPVRIMNRAEVLIIFFIYNLRKRSNGWFSPLLTGTSFKAKVSMSSIHAMFIP